MSATTMIISPTHFEGVAFVGKKTQPIRELAGFDRTRHKIPQKVDDFASKFVTEIANVDLRADLESNYQQLRNAFGFKRVDLNSANPAPGCGSIATPHFIYAISVSQLADDPATIVWDRSVMNIKTPDQIVSPAFAQVFNNRFDRIEFALNDLLDLTEWIDHVESLNDERFKLHYDSQATFCELQIENVNATIEVSESIVSVRHRQHANTNEILSSFLDVKRIIVDSFAGR